MFSIRQDLTNCVRKKSPSDNSLVYESGGGATGEWRTGSERAKKRDEEGKKERQKERSRGRNRK